MTQEMSLFTTYFVNFKAEFNKRQTNERAYTFASVVALSTNVTTYYHVFCCTNSFIINEMI